MMIKNVMKSSGFVLMFWVLPTVLASDHQLSSIMDGDKMVWQGFGLLPSMLSIDKISVKQNQPYIKAKDPAHRTNTEISEALGWSGSG